MISLEMDMVQYDCPYIDTTLDHDVSFLAKQWDFSTADRELETRIMVKGGDGDALDQGLSALREHQNMQSYELLRRKGEVALFRSRIDETTAMHAIRENDGYITGPFRIREGSETWHVGFDTEDVAEGALAELERHNDFSVEDRESVDLEDYYDLLQNLGSAKQLLDGCRSLSTVERETLVSAVQDGYFEEPRDATLSTLADEFDVSKMAVSKNLRRSQRKLLGQIAGELDAIEQ